MLGAAPSPVFSVFTPQPASPSPSAVSPQPSNDYPLLPRKGKGRATEEAGVSAEEITGTELIRSPKGSRHGENALSTSENKDYQQSFYQFGEPHLSSFISQSNFLSLTTPSLTTYKPGGFTFGTQEGQYFQLFRTHAASELSGFFDSEFWSRIILQQSHSEASIRHAVVALGALYKTLEETTLSTSGSSSESDYIHATAPAHYEFALRQYEKAIRLLREGISTRGVGSFRTTLMSIILFTCFTSFTGDQEGTIIQIQAGLNLLEERRQRTKQFIALSRDEFIEDELLEIFTRLAVQAKYYDMAFHFPNPYVVRLTSDRDDDQGISSQPSAILPLVSPTEGDISSFSQKIAHIPDVFVSIQDARSALFSLCERIMRFNEALSSSYGASNNTLPSSIRSSGYEFQSEFKQWSTAFDPLLQSRRQAGTSNAEITGICVLKMIQWMSLVQFMMTFSISEMDFDNFAGPYREIVELAKEVIHDIEMGRGITRCEKFSNWNCQQQLPELNPSQHVEEQKAHAHIEEASSPRIKASFTLDLGIIPPLHMVATTCRDRFIRREAIRLLTFTARREGMWDSIFCAKIAMWSMEIEEEGMVPFSGDNPYSDPLLPPDGQRVMIREVVSDFQRREAIIRCGTRGARDGDLDMKARESVVYW